MRPRDWVGYLYLGRAQTLGGDFFPAIETFDRGLVLHPRGRDLRSSKADALWISGKRLVAADLLAELLGEFPDDEPALDLARLYLASARGNADKVEIEARLQGLVER